MATLFDFQSSLWLISISWFIDVQDLCLAHTQLCTLEILLDSKYLFWHISPLGHNGALQPTAHYPRASKLFQTQLNFQGCETLDLSRVASHSLGKCAKQAEVFLLHASMTQRKKVQVTPTLRNTNAMKKSPNIRSPPLPSNWGGLPPPMKTSCLLITRCLLFLQLGQHLTLTRGGEAEEYILRDAGKQDTEQKWRMRPAQLWSPRQPGVLTARHIWWKLPPIGPKWV